MFVLRTIALDYCGREELPEHVNNKELVPELVRLEAY